jgi:hypothetical protein
MRFNDRSMALAGIPDLPADAFKKEGGKIKLYGGGSPPPQPTNTTQTTTTIPQYARPYVERMLGKTEALTNAPYQAFGGQRVSGFTPMQQQSFEAAQNLGPADQIGYGTKFAGLAGLRAGQANYNPTQFNNQYQAPDQFQAGQFYSGSTLMPGMAQAYMSPYQQAVSNIEKREALRQSTIQGQNLQAQAARAGAFGGTRQALQEAERQRNLMQQMGDIQARGGQAAYDRALQQFNVENQAMLEAQRMGEASRQFGYGQGMTAAESAARYGTEGQRLAEQSRQFGADLGMKGIQQQLSAAQIMRDLGASQFGQQESAMRAQSEAGALQQQREQQILDAQYQDFLNQQADQYKKISFMSDVLRGGPLVQSTDQRFQAPPSPLAQLTGAGVSALALRQLSRKEGGVTKSYANGGLVRLAIDQLAKG